MVAATGPPVPGAQYCVALRSIAALFLQIDLSYGSSNQQHQDCEHCHEY